jgi:hypothetical protein
MLFLLPLILLLALNSKLFSQTTWYVNQNANGSNDGTSVSNAWKTFASINWANIGTGTKTDSLLILPGIYYETLTVPPNKSNIVIAGINGKVIIDGQNLREVGVSLDNGTYANMKIYGLTVQNTLSRLISIANAANYSPIKNVVVEACSLYNYKSVGIFAEADGGGSEDSSYVTIKNNYLNDDNYFTGQSDGIYLQNLDSARVSGNTVINDNPTNPGSINIDWHSDDLQTHLVNSVCVDNNFFYMGSVYKGIGTQVLFTAEVFDRAGTHVYYNNVIVRNVPNAYDWAIRTAGNDGKIVYIINNTFFGYGRVQGADCGGFLENNIFYAHKGYQWNSFSSFGNPVTRSNNLIYDPDGAFGSMSGSIEDDPMFINSSYTSFDGRLKTSSPAIGTGKNLQTLIESFGLDWKDLNGNIRTNTPNMGAYGSDSSIVYQPSQSIPRTFVLLQNYPNPFNPGTTIKYYLPSESKVKLQIINLIGQQIKVLVDNIETPGYHEVSFKAGVLASGVYLYRLQAGDFVDVKKMILLK